jgi:hypothetical protein
MRVSSWWLGIAALLALLMMPGTASAQYGHPLHGSWSGSWGKNQEHRVLMNLDWDGKAISGEINPGANALKITKTDIDYSDPTAWKVKMEADGKDASGKAVHVTIDGTLQNIEVYYKILRGTWTENGTSGPFVLTRN